MEEIGDGDETINCLLCRGVVIFTQDDQDRYKDHLRREHRVTFYIAWIIEKTIAINCTFNEDEVVSNRKSQAMLTKNILQAHPSITITAIKNKSLELDGDSSDNFPDSEFPVDTELVEYDGSSMFSEDGESSNFSHSYSNEDNTTDIMDPATYVDEEVPHKLNDLTEARIMRRITNRGRKMYFCSMCPHLLFFQNIQQVERHQLTHVPLSHRKTFQCDTCKERFCSQKNLNTHREKNMCKGIRFYNCVKCDKYFDNRYDLNMHEETHEELSRRLSCHLCGAKFKQRKYLTKHVNRAHTNVKPFNCDICGKAFKSEYYVKQHRMNHFNGYGNDKIPTVNKPSILNSLLANPSVPSNCTKNPDFEEDVSDTDDVECLTDLKEIDHSEVKAEAKESTNVADQATDTEFIHIDC